MLDVKRFRGPYYDMLIEDILDDSWALVPSGEPISKALIIGNREQILNLYDESNNKGGFTYEK